MPTTPNHALTYPDSSGHTRLWEHLQQLANDVERELGELQGGWTTYTPTLTGTGSNPTTGAASKGRWRRIGAGTVAFQHSFQFTASVGSGFYVQQLPFVTADVGFDQTCLVGLFDASAGRHYVGRGLINPNSSTIVRSHTEGGSTLSSGAPVAPAAGDLIYASGVVEVV